MEIVLFSVFTVCCECNPLYIASPGNIPTGGDNCTTVEIFNSYKTEVLYYSHNYSCQNVLFLAVTARFSNS